MIALKLIFQTLAGVGAVGSVASGGYYMFNVGEDQYFLVSGLKETSDVTTEMWTAATSSPSTDQSTLKTKNYTCKSVPSSGAKTLQDDSCELYTINFAEKKIIDFEVLLAAKNDAKKAIKTDLTTKNFFLLKASNSLFSQTEFKNEEKIKLSCNKEISDTSNSVYATLTLHAKMSSTSLIGSTNLAIVKAKAPITTPLSSAESGKSYKCAFENLTREKKDCFLTIIGTLNASDELKTLTITSLTIPTTQTATTITENSYYLVSWKTDFFPISELKTKKIIFVEEPFVEANTAAKTAEFTVESPIFADLTTGKQQAILLK